MSPIEEPDFSVLVSRFEPAVTSTQVAPEPSMFLQMQERVEKHAKMKREKKLLKASKSASTVAGRNKDGPSNPISGDESSIISVSSSPRPPSPELNRKPPAAQSSTRPKAKPQPVARPKPVLTKKGKKEEVKMYPKDYAQMLNDQSEDPDPAEKRRHRKRFLVGKHIFYTGGDYKMASEATMQRMKLVSCCESLVLLNLL